MKFWKNVFVDTTNRPLALVGVLALIGGALLASAYSNNAAWWPA